MFSNPKIFLMNRVLTTEREYLKPAFTWNAHSMRINDLYISHVTDRVVSVSSDQTCKVILNSHKKRTYKFQLIKMNHFLLFINRSGALIMNRVVRLKICCSKQCQPHVYLTISKVICMWALSMETS